MSKSQKNDEKYPVTWQVEVNRDGAKIVVGGKCSLTQVRFAVSETIAELTSTPDPSPAE